MLARRVAIVLLLLITFSTANAFASTKPKLMHGSDIPDVQVAELEATARDVGNYLAAVDQENLAVYLAAVEAAQVASTAQVVQARSVPSNNGAHSDAWWQGVSVCEQGGRNDGYFGYFSIMDGSAGGLDWSTQVAMANAIIARAGDGAWAASCQAAGYAASPSG